MNPKKYKVVLWGAGEGYETLLNQLLFEIYKENITIEAIVVRKEDRYCKTKDNFPLIDKSELVNIDFDYIIDVTAGYYNEISNECKALGIDVRKIIKGEIFKIPLFDAGLYFNLIENPVTILSDDCWGGMFIIDYVCHLHHL